MKDNADSISDVICVFLQCFYLYGLKINYTIHMISISFPVHGKEMPINDTMAFIKQHATFPVHGKEMPINDSIYNYLDFS